MYFRETRKYFCFFICDSYGKLLSLVRETVCLPDVFSQNAKIPLLFYVRQPYKYPKKVLKRGAASDKPENLAPRATTTVDARRAWLPARGAVKTPSVNEF